MVLPLKATTHKREQNSNALPGLAVRLRRAHSRIQSSMRVCLTRGNATKSTDGTDRNLQRCLRHSCPPTGLMGIQTNIPTEKLCLRVMHPSFGRTSTRIILMQLQSSTFRSSHGRGYSCHGSLGVTPLLVRSWVPCGCCKARHPSFMSWQWLLLSGELRGYSAGCCSLVAR